MVFAQKHKDTNKNCSVYHACKLFWKCRPWKDPESIQPSIIFIKKEKQREREGGGERERGRERTLLPYFLRYYAKKLALCIKHSKTFLNNLVFY